ncbi:Dynein light chain 1, axonemal, partial [Borealophlyctis nickersoniae]
SKGTSIKDAIKLWVRTPEPSPILQFLLLAREEKHGQKAEEATVVKLIMQQPFIVKMDASIAQLVKVEHLSLGTNQIEKISNLQGLSNLKILSLGRNYIKKIEGLDAVADTLEELWISYNLLERLNGIESCKKLKVLYASNNKIKAMDGLSALSALPAIEDVLFYGNPLEEKMSADGTWVPEMSKRFPTLKKLDGKPIIREDDGGKEGEDGA